MLAVGSSGRGDLVYREWQTVVEYDGDQHRTSRIQYETDVARLENFALASWTVVRVLDHGLFSAPARTVGRVRAALTQNGWRPGAISGVESAQT